MSTESEANKTIMAQFWSSAFADTDRAVDLAFAPDWIDHDAAPDDPPGADGFKATLLRIKAGFPDARHLPMQLIADGDKVVAPWTIEGTHTQTYAGVAPTGRRVRVSGIQIDRLRDGKVVESWNHSSDRGLRAQIADGPPST